VLKISPKRKQRTEHDTRNPGQSSLHEANRTGTAAKTNLTQRQETFLGTGKRGKR